MLRLNRNNINDLKRRNKFLKLEKECVLLRSIKRNAFIEGDIVLKRLNSRKGKLGSIARIHNRCILTGRSRGIVRFYRISRLQLKTLGQRGLIIGLRRGSW